jgi:hypothetical protein
MRRSSHARRGVQLSPRIRHLGKITLYRTGPKSAAESAFPLTGPLLPALREVPRKFVCRVVIRPRHGSSAVVARALSIVVSGPGCRVGRPE